MILLSFWLVVVLLAVLFIRNARHMLTEKTAAEKALFAGGIVALATMLLMLFVGVFDLTHLDADSSDTWPKTRMVAKRVYHTPKVIARGMKKGGKAKAPAPAPKAP